MTCAFYFIVYDIVFHIERKINYFIFFIFYFYVTNQTLNCRELLNYSRPWRVWLVTSRLGTGISITFFYSAEYVSNKHTFLLKMSSLYKNKSAWFGIFVLKQSEYRYASKLLMIHPVVGVTPQSNELNRGTTELVQHFSLLYRGSSHRRKSPAWHKFDMVWIWRSQYPSGEEGGILLVQMITTCLHSAWGEGGSAPCGWPSPSAFFSLGSLENLI